MADQGLRSRRHVRRPARSDRAPLCRRQRSSASRPTSRWPSPIARMRMYDVSQLPVVEDGKIVGLVDESDLLLARLRSSGRLFATGATIHDHQSRNRAARRTAGTIAADFRSRPRGHRGRRSGLSRPDHASRRVELSAAATGRLTPQRSPRNHRDGYLAFDDQQLGRWHDHHADRADGSRGRGRVRGLPPARSTPAKRPIRRPAP